MRIVFHPDRAAHAGARIIPRSIEKLPPFLSTDRLLSLILLSFVPILHRLVWCPFDNAPFYFFNAWLVAHDFAQSRRIMPESGSLDDFDFTTRSPATELISSKGQGLRVPRDAASALDGARKVPPSRIVYGPGVSLLSHRDHRAA
jgi:hypothetical protein